MHSPIQSAIVWGDSLARGVVLDEERQRYTITPSPAVSIVSEALGIHIQNRSRMGMTSSDGMQMMQRDLARGLRADVAVLEFGGNDCDFCWQEISDAPKGLHLPKTSAAQYEENMRSMIAAAKEAGMEPVLINLPPVNPESYLSFLTRHGLSRENILRWLGDTFQIYRYQERYSMIVTRIAHECQCRLIDVRSAFLNVWDCTTALFCRDGIHPTAAGQKLIGDAVLASL